MLQKVVVLLPPRAETFELGVACEVFGVDRSDDGLPAYDLSIVAACPGAVHTRYYDLDIPHDLDCLASADLIIVGAGGDAVDESDDAVAVTKTTGTLDPALGALCRAAQRGTAVASLCTGAFLLGAAGLLDGRRCTTHWRHSAALAARFPDALVDPSVLYVDDHPIYTSAGTAASIDLCLHIVRKFQGSDVANGIARRMVVPPHREGGQAQFVNRPLPRHNGSSMAPLLDWMTVNLRDDHSVSDLAARAGMSSRTFARRFQAETGSTPARWLNDQRVLEAQRLLETTDLTVESIADRVGFRNAAALRIHFQRVRLTSPNEYRRVFARA
ncbi:GlxA family transcriptional regulator [Hoyosella altamirensis]|uniref:Transcriptional regulator GlxA family with amidase domain n=1 Tax=Hoyosella altamirensis TaxID=616997 RepID=A0A839RNY9_9ACTN|nr:helix-turn-helix domain-containing protein [Hoyosella altamirensis]MBB3038712.1 transcriptional regulator GlxA family with amidase domain [Hoyosella altamirensis]